LSEKKYCINIENPSGQLPLINSNEINTTTLTVADPNVKVSTKFETSQGSIRIGSSNNTRFGSTDNVLIFSNTVDSNKNFAIGTLNGSEDLILGSDNTERLRIKGNGAIILTGLPNSRSKCYWSDMERCWCFKNISVNLYAIFILIKV